MKWAFSNCQSLREIEIPEHVTFVDKRAFQDCCKLVQEMHIPNNVTMMGEVVFQYCSSLARVKFDTKVDKICMYMLFYWLMLCFR